MTKPSNMTIDTSSKACPVPGYTAQPSPPSPTSVARMDDLVRNHSYYIVPMLGYTTEYEARYTWPSTDGHKIFCKSPTKRAKVITQTFIFPGGVLTNYETEYKEHFSPRFTPGKALFQAAI
jgi:hypothetical protein